MYDVPVVLVFDQIIDSGYHSMIIPHLLSGLPRYIIHKPASRIQCLIDMKP
jgi:hypothetical protein